MLTDHVSRIDRYFITNLLVFDIDDFALYKSVFQNINIIFDCSSSVIMKGTYLAHLVDWVNM